MLDDVELSTVIAEMIRLLEEAEHRFEEGQVLPALSSLSAVPNLHRHLLESCAELLSDDEDEATVHTIHAGTYL